MEVINKNCPKGPAEEGEKKIIINEKEYSYLISKSEKNGSLTIKLFESTQKTNFFFYMKLPFLN